MKTYRMDELIDQYIGKKGSPNRDAYEKALKEVLDNEKVKITVKVTNKQLLALEHLLYCILNEDELETAKNECRELLSKLQKAYDRI